MSPDPVFKIVSPEQATGATKTIEFQITPLAGAPAGGKEAPLRFEFDFEVRVLPKEVAAAEEAAGRDSKRLAPCAAALKLAGGGSKWTAWIRKSVKAEVITVLVSNDLDAELKPVAPAQRGTVGSASPLRLTVALKPTEEKIPLEINYRYGTEYFRSAVRYDYTGDLKLWQVPSGEPPPPSMPVVDLYCDAESPTALNLGETVKLFWVIEGGKNAKLLGPLGGKSVRELGSDEIAKGRLQVQVLGASVFLLQADVVHRGEKLVVVRTLTLDIITPEKMCALRLVPDIFLPNGSLSVFWWVSGVFNARVYIGQLTNEQVVKEDSPVSTRGEYKFKATSKITKRLTVKLAVNEGGAGELNSIDKELTYRSWVAESAKSPPPWPSQPYGYHLAHGRLPGHEYLLYGTPQGTWWAETELDDLTFARTTLEPHPCLGVGTGPAGFAILQKTPSAVQLVLYTPGEKPKADTLSLPPSLDIYFQQSFDALSQRWGSRLQSAGTAYRFVVVGSRAYVAGHWHLTMRDRSEEFASEAWSLDLKAQDGWRYEPYLAALHGYELVACAGAIFGFDRATGRLLRLDADPKAANGGTLANPRFCAPGVASDGESMLKTGHPVAVEGLLVFVGSQKKRDWVYNSKSDSWNECGKEDGVARAAAYRGGTSTRMWAVYDEGLYSLSVGDPQLFCPDYRQARPLAVLEKGLFDLAVEYTVTNATGGDLLPLGDTMTLGGYFPAMSRSPRFASGRPPLLRKGESAKIRVECDSADVAEVVWRWRSPEPGLIIRVETTYVKRPEDAWGFRFFYDNLPDKAGAPSNALLILRYQQHSTAVSLLKPLQRSRLHLYNATPYHLQFLGERTLPAKTATIDFGVLENVDPYFTKDTSTIAVRQDEAFLFSGDILIDMNRPEGIGPAIGEDKNPRVAVKTTLVKDETTKPTVMLKLAPGQTSVYGSDLGAEVALSPLAGGTNYFLGFGRIPWIKNESILASAGSNTYRLFLDYFTYAATRVSVEIRTQNIARADSMIYPMKGDGQRRDPVSGETFQYWKAFLVGDPKKAAGNSPEVVFSASAKNPKIVVSITPENVIGGTVVRGKAAERSLHPK